MTSTTFLKETTKKQAAPTLDSTAPVQKQSSQKELAQKELARDLFSQYSYKDYQQKLEKLSPENLKQLIDFFSDHFLKEKKRFLLLNSNEEKALGLVSLRDFSLLSSVLKLNAFLVKDFYASQQLNLQNRRETYKKMAKWLQNQYKNAPSFASARVAIEDNLAVSALSEANFYYVTSESLFCKTITKDDFPKNFESMITNIRPYKPSDLEKIKSIACENHKIGKFHCDTNFSHEEIKTIYVKTLESSLKCDRHKVFVYALGEEVIGFITIIENKSLSEKLQRGYGSLDYICVKKDYQKGGIGLALNLFGMNYLHKRHCSTLYVKTLSHNYPAINLLNKSNFSLASTSLIYHYLKR